MVEPEHFLASEMADGDKRESVDAPLASDSPSLRSNFIWTFAGNVVYGACQWGMLSTLAKLGTPGIVGQFTLGLAVSAPVFMFTNLQLRCVQATDVRIEGRFADYFMLRLLSTLAGLIAIIALLPIAGASPRVRFVIVLISVSKCIECMSDVTAGLLQREEQLRRVAISLMMRGIGSIVVFSLIFARFRNLELSVVAMSGVWLLVLLFYDVPNVRVFDDNGLFRFDKRGLWRIAMLGLPLGWVATLASLNVNVPRYFLQHYLGLAEQGIFASLAYLIVAVNLVVSALTQSVTTRLARLFAEGEIEEFSRLLTRLSMLGALITVVGVPMTYVAGRPLVMLFYGREYAEHVGLLALFVAISGVSTIGSFIFCGLTAARMFQIQVPVYIATVVVTIAGAALLVPRLGLIGAGTALLLSAIALVVGGLWMMREALSVELQKQ